MVNAGSNDISVIEVSTKKGLAHIDVGDHPRGIVLSPDETTLYANNTLSGSISVIDPTGMVPTPICHKASCWTQTPSWPICLTLAPT